MAEEAAVAAGEEVVFHVVVDPGWGPYATAEATAPADRVPPAPIPTIRAGRVPYLTTAAMPRVAALSVRETDRIATPNGRVIGRTTALNARATGKRNRVNGRKPVVIARKKVLTADRNGVKMPMVIT
jgi:hypothetical protein